jgi:hypothetical protein
MNPITWKQMRQLLELQQEPMRQLLGLRQEPMRQLLGQQLVLVQEQELLLLFCRKRTKQLQR